MQHNNRIGLASEIEIIFETIIQLEKIFATQANDDLVKYGHIIDHIRACKQDFFTLLQINDIPTIQQLNDFEKKLYSGRIFNPKSKKNIKQKKLRYHAHIGEGVAASNQLDSCDIFWTPKPPTYTTWKDFLHKTQSNAAYVRSRNKLIYLNKHTEEFTEIPLSGFN